jgi:H+/Cl- antiporter ClcA
VIQNWLRLVPRKYAHQVYVFVTDPGNIQNVGFWVSALLAGFVSVLYALAFRWLERTSREYLSAVHGPWAFVIAPVSFLLAWWVVRRFAPPAAGSGIPQIMAANEMEYQGEAQLQVDRLLSLRTMVAKVLSSLLCVAGGGAIGREGPTLQISASIFHLFGQRLRRFVPETRAQTWIVAGAAAGLASAFNTPLGGIVYAIEELGAQHFHRIRTALLSAVIVAGLVAQWLLGSYLYLGFPSLQTINFGFLPWALVVGVAAGGLGGIFGHLLYRLASWRNDLVDWRAQALMTLACGLGVAGLVQFTSHATGPGLETITGLLFRDEHAGPALVATRFASTMISYLSGAAGGIFSPSLAVGATLGAWLTDLLNVQHGHLMVLLGMIGFLTGVTRTPFTSFILVLEMTDRHAAIFPMMMTSLIALWAARQIDRVGFYEHMKERYLIHNTRK